MPTYYYLCAASAQQFEAYESTMPAPQTVCPTCHESRLRRKIGPGAAILFKGSGFYQTDYRSDSYKKGAEADKSSSSPAKASSSDASTSPPSTPAPAPAKTESKPAGGGS